MGYGRLVQHTGLGYLTLILLWTEARGSRSFILVNFFPSMIMKLISYTKFLKKKSIDVRVLVKVLMFVYQRARVDQI